MKINILKIYLIGILFLLGAIIINVTSKLLNLLTWYDFLFEPSSLTLISAIYLFGIYPLLLGYLVFITSKIIK